MFESSPRVSLLSNGHDCAMYLLANGIVVYAGLGPFEYVVDAILICTLCGLQG
jgi:hypothetical protein